MEWQLWKDAHKSTWHIVELTIVGFTFCAKQMSPYITTNAVHETVGHDQVAHKIGCLCISL